MIRFTESEVENTTFAGLQWLRCTVLRRHAIATFGVRAGIVTGLFAERPA